MEKKYAVYQITNTTTNTQSLVRRELSSPKEAVEIINSYAGGSFVIQEYYTR